MHNAMTAFGGIVEFVKVRNTKVEVVLVLYVRGTAEMLLIYTRMYFVRILFA